MMFDRKLSNIICPVLRGSYCLSTQNLIRPGMKSRNLFKACLTDVRFLSVEKSQTFTAGLPNLFSVAGHFHMRKFIAGHKRCDVTNLLILVSFMQ